MPNDLRVVVDTNVLVSGLFGIENAPPLKILTAIRKQRIILVTSAVIMEEVSTVINREKISKKIHLNEEERKVFIDELIARSDVTVGKQLERNFGRDIKDDKFLACGIEGEVDYIITGDRDLLVLTGYEGIKIVSPRDFVDLVWL
jgi:putative PIN family toxin of toxin-antitoxin system